MPADYRLNEKQILTLKLAYKFRYLTTYTLARRRNISHHSAYSSLNKLVKKGYLDKLHQPVYKKLGIPARYCLSKEAVKLLVDPKFELNKNVLLTRRRENQHSDTFIDNQLRLFKFYLCLKEMDSNLNILTATEMAKYDHFIRPLPGLCVSATSRSARLLIELTDHQHIFMTKKRVRNYIKHFESNEWQWGEYPTVVFLRETESDREKLYNYIIEQLDDSYLDNEDIKFVVCSESELIEGRFF